MSKQYVDGQIFITFKKSTPAQDAKSLIGAYGLKTINVFHVADNLFSTQRKNLFQKMKDQRLDKHCLREFLSKVCVEFLM